MKCEQCGREIYLGDEFVTVLKNGKPQYALCLDCDEEDQEEGEAE